MPDEPSRFLVDVLVFDDHGMQGGRVEDVEHAVLQVMGLE